MSNEADIIAPFTTLLPGHGRPLNYTPVVEASDYAGALIGSALSSASFHEAMLPLTTLREFLMLQLMNSITDKADWNIKINDPKIAGKWKEEALASTSDMTTKMVDWCIDELRCKASLIPEGLPPPPIIVYNGDVVKSDSALPIDYRVSLQNAVMAFEKKIPERLKDWHPGSGEKVLDLVHPSLFPLVYGRTRILENGEVTNLKDCISRCGEGSILDVPDEEQTFEPNSHRRYRPFRENPYSRRFQWLPCEVDISQDTSRIASYINNLHPLEEKPLYGLIEQLIDACIPLWDLTLAPLCSPRFRHSLRIDFSQVVYTQEIEGTQETNETSDIGLEDVSAEAEDSDDDGSESSDTASVVHPEPEKPFSPQPSPQKFSLKERYGKRGLQIIVKLANIELTPEKPEYEGGSWHIEGQLNEHIVATALYYYSSTNITASSLSFRQWFSEEDAIEIGYQQCHYAWLPVIYGCEHEGPSVQDVGSVDTREGRLLTFPNILQHRVDPFKLADPTKPGHRKIVALFLVDPNIKIISTAHVPCQRQDWWLEAGVLDQGPGNLSLPRELQDKVLEDVDFPFSLREAKTLREDLMAERKEVSANHSKVLSRHYTISLCEH